MGLIDEAIGEFELAAQDNRYLTESASLLGACLVEKGESIEAARWYQKALSVSDLEDEVRLGLLYELGEVFEGAEQSDKARETYAEILGIDSQYRDVVAKLEAFGD